MTLCTDLSDVTDARVAALVPQWLELVAERMAAPGVRVRPSGHVLNVLLAQKLLLTVFCAADGDWQLRVQSMVTIEELGAAGRPFSTVGTVRLGCGGGCGDPVKLARRVTELLDVATLLPLVDPGPDRRLLGLWCAHVGVASPH